MFLCSQNSFCAVAMGGSKKLTTAINLGMKTIVFLRVDTILQNIISQYRCSQYFLTPLVIMEPKWKECVFKNMHSKTGKQPIFWKANGPDSGI